MSPWLFVFRGSVSPAGGAGLRSACVPHRPPRRPPFCFYPVPKRPPDSHSQPPPRMALRRWRCPLFVFTCLAFFAGGCFLALPSGRLRHFSGLPRSTGCTRPFRSVRTITFRRTPRSSPLAPLALLPNSTLRSSSGARTEARPPGWPPPAQTAGGTPANTSRPKTGSRFPER